MVERMSCAYTVARQQHYRTAFHSEMLRWDQVSEAERDGIRHGIIAAIAAMREPTEEMISAGWDQDVEQTVYPGKTWQDMIDEALK